ncbi:TlpA family protein disulfide reductase [Streptomyces sp. BA2]|uniref:TlpA family protein disulfide reductase n=1 Tax=Streptomyces sp. BA2 TaxID=436595 RepID=UPI0013297562|nr:hypothetical protein [Streptomyces sp. BA2]MWA16068.1 hypothetical protein [Streptomyces sp. BA2]
MPEVGDHDRPRQLPMIAGVTLPRHNGRTEGVNTRYGTARSFDSPGCGVADYALGDLPAMKKIAWAAAAVMVAGVALSECSAEPAVKLPRGVTGTGIPFTVFIDRQGRVASVVRGPISEDVTRSLAGPLLKEPA